MAWHESIQSPTNMRAQEKQRAPGIAIPGESFVFLQDSVVHNIPTLPPRQQKLSLTSKYPPSHKREPTPTPPVPLAPPIPSPLSHHLESTNRLFRLLSSRTELDHPLCAECTHMLISVRSKQLEETKKERDGYIAFEKEIRKDKEREKHAASPDTIERKIQRLKEEERNAMEDLRAAEAERAKLDEELRAWEQEEKVLAEEEAE